MTPKQRPKIQLDPRIAQAVAILRAYGVQAEIDQAKPKLGAREVDAILRLQKGLHETLLMVELKPDLNNATLATAIQQAGKDNATLLVANYVPPFIADHLRKNKIGFVDLAGNTWLKTPEYFVWVEGRKPVRPIPVPTAARAFQTRGLQLIFAVLTNPDWIGLPTRTLAEKIGIANGTVAAALRDLEERGFVVRATQNRARRLRNRRVLLDKWTEGYLQRLQPTNIMNRYRRDADDPNWWKNIQPERHHALLGGEPAAAILTQFLTPGEVTVYIEGGPGPLIMDQHLRLDPHGNIVLRRKFWKFEAEEWTHKELAPPVLIYADLMGAGDARCIETAGRVRDQYLARLLED